MTSLTRVTDATRKLLEIVGISIAGIILLVIVFSIGKAIKEYISPTPPPPPTVSFGKLPAISFPQSFFQQDFSYTLNTLTGTLPVLPPSITVYKLTQPQPSLTNLDRAKAIAQAANFKDNPTPLSETLYAWTNTTPFLQTFTMDINSTDFTLKSSYATDPAVNAAQYVPSEEDAKKAADSFFSGVEPLPDSIDTSKTKATLLKITGNKLLPASSLSSAQIIRVDYFPKNIDTLPILTANPDNSLIYALVASSDTTNPQIVEAQMYHKNVSKEKATYPMKTAQQAFDELKKGQGYIASAPEGQSQITITNVSLGYYIGIEPEDYLLPIIIFEGDQGFVAYVPAITSSWVKNSL